MFSVPGALYGWEKFQSQMFNVNIDIIMLMLIYWWASDKLVSAHIRTLIFWIFTRAVKLIKHLQKVKDCLHALTRLNIYFPSSIFFQPSPIRTSVHLKSCLFCILCAQWTRMSIFNLMVAIILRGQLQQRSSQMLPRLVKWESRITCTWCCTDQVVHLVPQLGHHS